MEKRNFVKKIKNVLELMPKKEIIEYIQEQARKIEKEDQQQFLEELQSYSTEHKKVTRSYTTDEYLQIKSFLEELSENELCLEAQMDESDSGYWSDTPDYIYSDLEGIGESLEEALDIAKNFLYHKQYKEAAEIYSTILNLEVWVEERDGYGESWTLDFEELLENQVLVINQEELPQSILYAEYQSYIGEERAERIYELILQNSFLQAEPIEHLVENWEEELPDFYEFMEDWICYLELKRSDLSSRLLWEAVNYHFDEEQKLEFVRNHSKNFPSLYQKIIESYYQQEEYERVVKIGKEAIYYIDRKLLIRSKVALITARAALHIENEEIMYMCWYSAYESDSSIKNYLRMFAFPERVKECLTDLIQIFEDKVVGESNYYRPVKMKEQEANLLDRREAELESFFMGNFSSMKIYCMDKSESPERSSTYIREILDFMLLYLYDEEKLAPGQQKVVRLLEHDLEFSNHEDEFYLVKEVEESIFFRLFLEWKKYYPITLQEKKEHLAWVKEKIAERTNFILKRQQRESYGAVALLIAAAGEAEESLGEPNAKEVLMKQYETEYKRYSAFRKELKALK